MGLGSDDDDDDSDDEETGEGVKAGDGNADKEDTIQTNMEEMDTFRLPGAEERAKESE